MQTFLPYPNFFASVWCLDSRRLGKQRVEARQIQDAIQNETGWSRHACTRMWRDNVLALMLYGDCAIREWERRGYVNNMPLMFADLSAPFVLEIEMPSWLGDESFHSSHRAALLAKMPEHYEKFGWTEKPEIDYVWPR